MFAFCPGLVGFCIVTPAHPRPGPKHALAPKLDFIFFISSSLRHGSGFLLMVPTTLVPFCFSDSRWGNHLCWTVQKRIGEVPSLPNSKNSSVPDPRPSTSIQSCRAISVFQLTVCLPSVPKRQQSDLFSLKLHIAQKKDYRTNFSVAPYVRWNLLLGSPCLCSLGTYRTRKDSRLCWTFVSQKVGGGLLRKNSVPMTPNVMCRIMDYKKK